MTAHVRVLKAVFSDQKTFEDAKQVRDELLAKYEEVPWKWQHTPKRAGEFGKLAEVRGQEAYVWFADGTSEIYHVSEIQRVYGREFDLNPQLLPNFAELRSAISGILNQIRELKTGYSNWENSTKVTGIRTKRLRIEGNVKQAQVDAVMAEAKKLLSGLGYVYTIRTDNPLCGDFSEDGRWVRNRELKNNSLIIYYRSDKYTKLRSVVLWNGKPYRVLEYDYNNNSIVITDFWESGETFTVNLDEVKYTSFYKVWKAAWVVRERNNQLDLVPYDVWISDYKFGDISVKVGPRERLTDYVTPAS